MSLGHNPNATPEEILEFRRNFNLRDHLKGTPTNGTEKPTHITKEQVITLCRAYRIELADSAKLKALEDRARLAEASAANAIAELKAIKGE